MLHWGFPGFFAGLLLIAAPLLLHLLKRRPKTVLPFPSFFFLNDKLVRKQQRNNLLKILVLCCRIGFLSALAAAFAWPYFSGIAPRPESATVLVVDGSFSMPERAALALSSAELSSIGAAHPMRAIVAKTTFSASPEFVTEGSMLRKWIAENASSEETSKLYSAILAADAMLGEIPAQKRRIVIFSDRQKVPFQNLPRGKKLRFATQILLRTPPGTAPRGNLSVGMVHFAPEVLEEKTPVEIRATLCNFNDRESPAEVELFVNNRSVARRNLTVPPRGSVEECFTLPPVAGEVPFLDGKCVIRGLDRDNAIAADDVFYFAINRRSTVPILFSGDMRQSFLPDVLPLQALKAPDKADPSANLWIVEKISPGEAKAFSRAAKQFLQQGKCCAVVWENTQEMCDFLGAFDFRVRRRSTPEVRKFEMIRFDHRLFQDYLKVNAGSWFEPLFFDVPQIVPPHTAAVPALFTGNLPAVMEQKEGSGTLLVIAAATGKNHSNWQTFGNFLPFWRALAEGVKQSGGMPEHLTVNGSTVFPPGGESIRLVKAGNVLRMGKQYSVNVPAIESENALLPETFTLDDWIDPNAAGRAAGEHRSSRTVLSAAANRQNHWKIFLWAALLLLLVETALSNKAVC